MVDGRVWLVRAGSKGRFVGDFEVTGTVSIGWGDIPGLDDLAALDADGILALLEAAPAPNPKAERAEILTFRDQMAVGDVAITVDSGHDEVLVGEVEGAYEWRPEARVGGEHAHVRRVRWYGRYSRDLLSSDMKKATGFRKTIRELPADEWAAFAAGTRDGSIAAAAPRVGRAAAKGKAKAPVVVVPEPITHLTCPECRYQKLKAQFTAGSDRCVDCRDRAGEL